MSAPESQVLAAIAELEAEENPDDITELVRWQLAQGVERGEVSPELQSAAMPFGIMEQMQQYLQRQNPWVRWATNPALRVSSSGPWDFVCGECGAQAQSEHRSIQCPGCGARRVAVGPPYPSAR